MNRRAAIRKAVGLGAVAAAFPVLDKVLSANDRMYTGNQACSSVPCGVGEWKPPPPDTRTPEQIITDQEQEMIQDIVRHLTREQESWQKKYAYQVWNREFEGALAVLREQGVAFTEGQLNGMDHIIGPNGNIARRITQTLHLAY